MRFIFWTVLLFILWMILSESTQIENITIGLLVSTLISAVSIRLFKEDKFEIISPFWLFVYLFVLLKNLITSNMLLSKIILRKKIIISPAIVKVKTTLKSDWKKLMLANSITLTPGTLTLDIIDDYLFIHTISYDENMDKREIIREFEEIIEKI